MSRHDVGASGEDGLQGTACSHPLGYHKLNALRSSDNMRVGDDVPGRIDDETGADGTLPAESQGGGAVLGGLDGAVAGNKYLHHAGRNLFDQGVDRFVEFAERILAALLRSYFTRQRGNERRGCNSK